MAARALMPVRELNDQAVVTQPIVPLCDEIHPVYGRVKFGPADFQRWEQEFSEMEVAEGDERELSITLQHDPSKGAVGWIRGVKAGETALAGELHFNSAGVQAIDDRSFPYLSPEVGADGKFKGLSLVVNPFFKGKLPSVKLPAPEGAEFADSEPGLLIFGDPEDLGLTGSDAQPTHRLRTEPEDEPEDADHATADDPGSSDGAGQDFADRATVLNLEAQVAELERDKRTREFADELAAMTFGEDQRLAPAFRSELAGLLAKLPAEDGQKLAKLLGGMRFYAPGEIGFSAPPSRPALTEEDRIVAAQLGLAEES